MSGGHIRGLWNLYDTAEELESIAKTGKDWDDEVCNISQASKDNFIILAEETRQLHEKLRAADKLIMGDIGDETFNAHF